MEFAYENDIYILPMVAPASEERIKNILKEGKGFVYCVSINGVTGTRENISTDLSNYINLIKEYSQLPKAIGFGVSNVEMTKEFSKYAEGVIVGSAIIKRMASTDNKEEGIKRAVSLVKELKEALRS